MKLVDENGKLFKKFNLVDTTVALLLAIIVAAIGWKIVSARVTAARENSETTQAYENSPHLVYEVVCRDIPNEIAEAFESQMALPLVDRQLMAGREAVEGYITGCRVVPQEPVEEHANIVYFTIEALSTEKDGIYSVGTQEVRLGKSHIVKTYNIETSGWVCSMDPPEKTPEGDTADE